MPAESTAFNRIAKSIVESLGIPMTAVIGANRRGYGSRGLPKKTLFDEFRKSLEEELDKVTSIDEASCKTIIKLIADERKCLTVNNDPETDMTETERRYYRKLIVSYKKIRDENLIKNYNETDDEDCKREVKEFFISAFEEGYKITETYRDLKKVGKKAANLIEKATRESQRKQAADRTLQGLDDKCFLHFSNKNYQVQQGEKYFSPFSVVYFDLTFCANFDDGLRVADDIEDGWYNDFDNYFKLNSYHSERAERFIAFLLGYACATSANAIKEYLYTVSDDILPDKEKVLNFIKQISALSVEEQRELLYQACIDKDLLQKYRKNINDYIESTLLPFCTYSNAIKTTKHLLEISKEHCDVDGIIIYEYAALDLETMGSKRYDLMKKYNVYTAVFSEFKKYPHFIVNEEAVNFLRFVLKDAPTKASAVDYCMLLLKACKANGSKALQSAEKAVVSLVYFDNDLCQSLIDKANEGIVADPSEEIFEERCMKVIELIVEQDKNNTRKDAIKIARQLLAQAINEKNGGDYPLYNQLLKRVGCPPVEISLVENDIPVYKRVLNEFEIATDKEYNLLRSQIFS